MRRFSGVASTIFACTGLAACGKTVAYTDAGTTDAADHDAMTVTGSVTVTTNARCCDRPPGTPVSGVDVFVHQPDGSLGDSGQTDGTGTITFEDVREGSSITALYADVDGQEYDLVTVVGVQPGDELVFGEQFDPQETGVDGQMTVTWPALPGAYYYYVYHPCGSAYGNSAATSSIAYQYTYCQTPTADLQFTAYDTSYRPTHSVVLRDVPYTNGQTAAIAAWTAHGTFTVNATAIPSVVEEIGLGAYSVLDGIASIGDSQYTSSPGNSASVSFPIAAGTDRITAWSQIYHTGDLGQQETYQQLAAGATSADFAINELPWVGDTIVSAAGRLATWVQVGDQSYDGAVVYANWERFEPAPLDGGEGGTYTDYEWTVLLPPGVTTWTWGDPPAALAEHAPGELDELYGGIALVDLSSTDDYAALRNTPEWMFASPYYAVEAGDLDSATMSYGDGGEGFDATADKQPPWRRRAVAPARPPR